MKFLIEVGSQLDLNVAYNGGAADAGLIYTVPEDNGFITVNASTGVVDAVAEGESVVWVYSGTPSVLVATVVIEVASAATYAERLAIRDGDNEVIVTAGAVASTPAYTLIVNGTPHGTSGMYLEGPDKAFDGLDGNSATPTLYVSQATFGSITGAFIGLNFGEPKMVKKLRIQWVTAPDSVSVRTEGWEQPSIYDFTPVYTENAPAGQWVWQEIILPPYTPSTQLVLRPNTYNALPGTYWALNGGVIDRFRVYEIEMFE